MFYKSTISLFCFLLTTPVFSVYIMPSEAEDSFEKYMYDTTTPGARNPYEYAVQISCKDKGTAGTGSLIHPQAVLTVLHVVHDRESDQPNDPEQMVVYYYNEGIEKSVQVKKVEFFDNGFFLGKREENRNDSLAILFLSEPIQGVEPVNIRSIELDETIERVTMMGYGSGGILSPEHFPPEDLFLSSKLILRYAQDVEGEISLSVLFKQTLPEISVSQRKCKIGNGDSGSALLDDDGNLIGVAKSGAKRLGRMLDKKGALERFLSIQTGQALIAQEYLNELNRRTQRNCWERLKDLFFGMTPLSAVPEIPCSNDVSHDVHKEMVQAALDDILSFNVYLYLKSIHLPLDANCIREPFPKASPALVEAFREDMSFLEFITNGGGSHFGNYFTGISPEALDWINFQLSGEKGEFDEGLTVTRTVEVS